MFCSIDKIDLAARVDGKPIAVQMDLRSREEILDAPELSILFAMARIVNARAQLADDGHRGIDGESTFGMLRKEALPKPPEAALVPVPTGKFFGGLWRRLLGRK